MLGISVSMQLISKEIEAKVRSIGSLGPNGPSIWLGIGRGLVYEPMLFKQLLSPGWHKMPTIFQDS